MEIGKMFAALMEGSLTRDGFVNLFRAMTTAGTLNENFSACKSDN
jgi:hypothetical protein